MASVVEETVISIGQSRALVFGTISFDSSYPTGGEAIDAPGDVGYEYALVSPNAGYVGYWDRANQKLLAYQQSAATSALTQVPNATNMATVAFPFIGVRSK